MMQLRQSIKANFQFGVMLTHGMNLIHAISDLESSPSNGVRILASFVNGKTAGKQSQG